MGLVEVGRDDHPLEVLLLVGVLEELANPFEKVVESSIDIRLEIKF